MKVCGILWVFMILLFVNVFLLIRVNLLPPPPQQPLIVLRSPPAKQPEPVLVNRPVPSQSLVSGYAIVGYLESVTQGMIPLYARPSPTHRHRFNYYTRNSNEYLIRLPIIKDGRDCTNNLGCDELYDKDVVHVPGIPDPLTVHKYSKEF